MHLILSSLAGATSGSELRGPENPGNKCWFNSCTQGLATCPTVFRAIRNIRPRGDGEPINAADALIEGIQRVLCLRTSASFKKSNRSWAELAETIIPGEEQQDPADAFEKVTFEDLGPDNVFSKVIFPSHLEVEVVTVVTPHKDSCKDSTDGDKRGVVRVGRKANGAGAVFVVKQELFEAANSAHDRRDPLHYVDGTASYFEDAVLDLSDDDSDVDDFDGGGDGSASRGKPGSCLFIRCLNSLLNPPVIFHEPDFEVVEGDRRPKDCCRHCRVRIKVAESRRLLTLSDLIVVEIQRSKANVRIPAPQEIVLHNWGTTFACKPPRKYTLRAVIHRRGDVAGRGGHWWANLRQPDGWLCCDDASVSRVTSAGDAKTATVFLYEDVTVASRDDDDDDDDEGGAHAAGDGGGKVRQSKGAAEVDDGRGIDSDGDDEATGEKVLVRGVAKLLSVSHYWYLFFIRVQGETSGESISGALVF